MHFNLWIWILRLYIKCVVKLLLTDLSIVMCFFVVAVLKKCQALKMHEAGYFSQLKFGETVELLKNTNTRWGRKNVGHLNIDEPAKGYKCTELSIPSSKIPSSGLKFIARYRPRWSSPCQVSLPYLFCFRLSLLFSLHFYLFFSPCNASSFPLCVLHLCSSLIANFAKETLQLRLYRMWPRR